MQSVCNLVSLLPSRAVIVRRVRDRENVGVDRARVSSANWFRGARGRTCDRNVNNLGVEVLILVSEMSNDCTGED